MSVPSPATPPVEEPLAVLERSLIHAYLAGARLDYQSLAAREDDEARRILGEASRYASSKLTEIEARFHYLSSMHE
jgi:hypothetical protein